MAISKKLLEDLERIRKGAENAAAPFTSAKASFDHAGAAMAYALQATAPGPSDLKDLTDNFKHATTWLEEGAPVINYSKEQITGPAIFVQQHRSIFLLPRIKATHVCVVEGMYHLHRVGLSPHPDASKPRQLGFCTNKRDFILPEEALGVAVKADQVKPGSLLNHNRLLVADLNPHPLKMQAIEAGTKQITNVDTSTWEADIDTIHKSNLERDCAWLLPQLEKRGYRIGKWQTDLAPVALLSPAQLTSIHNPLGIVLMIPAIGLVDLYFALVKSEPEYQYAWFSFFGDIRNIDPSYTKQQLLNSNPAAWAFILGEET